MKARGTLGGEMRRERKSLRIGVHLANAVVWGPVRTRSYGDRREKRTRLRSDAERFATSSPA